MTRHIPIFDSRKASKVYGGEEYPHYRSADFYIPPGMVALVELTTHHQYYSRMTFTAIRRPRALGKQDCFDTSCQGKRYHQVACGVHLGNRTPKQGSSSSVTPFTKNLLRWGYDSHNDEVFEYHYITRPGDYYLIADKISNEEIKDCERPTIIEVMLIPAQAHYNIAELCHD